MTTERKPPTYNRQRLLLFLLEQTDGRLSKMDFQKLLFLAHESGSFDYYDFVPYHYGCYSFQAAEDLETLEHQGWIKSDERHLSLKDSPYLGAKAKLDERNEIKLLMHRYQSLRGDELLKEVYSRFPYYAVNSKIADRVVEDKTLKEIAEQKAQISKTEWCLFTLGYEGLSFETYLNRLIQNNVRILCDVRKNPLSRKFGFSKNTLATVLPKLGIEYRHIPELGIVSEKRKHLESPQDYDLLFEEYTANLSQMDEQLCLLKKWLDQFHRIALTCYEENPGFCHRSRIAEYLNKRHQMKAVHL